MSARIGTYNIQNMGKEKFAELGNHIIEIVKSYEVICIQEFRDTNTTFLLHFLNCLNGRAVHNEKFSTKPSTDSFTTMKSDVLLFSGAESDKFGAIASPPLGPGQRTERYAIVFRKDLWVVRDVYLCLAATEFARPPLAARLAWKKYPKKQIAVICIHTKPAAAKEELSSLCDVYHHLLVQWEPSWRAELAWKLGLGRKRVMPIILGDFNAGKNYVPIRDRASHKLWQDETLKWLIEDDEDTTVGKSYQAYDRILIGKIFEKYFRNVGINNLEGRPASDLSDHFPVHVSVQLK